MGAILLLEWPAADPLRRQEARQRLAALALLESAQLLFAAADGSVAEPAGVLAISFSGGQRAKTALSRWQAEGALPAGGTARILMAEPCGPDEAPLLLFP